MACSCFFAACGCLSCAIALAGGSDGRPPLPSNGSFDTGSFFFCFSSPSVHSFLLPVLCYIVLSVRSASSPHLLLSRTSLHRFTATNDSIRFDTMTRRDSVVRAVFICVVFLHCCVAWSTRCSQFALFRSVRFRFKRFGWQHRMSLSFHLFFGSPRYISSSTATLLIRCPAGVHYVLT